jgi:lipoprotein-anchoring transpeptidase ErfK/SrfK
MVKGFYLSLDHQFPANGWTWWKTVAGLIAPLERIIITKPVTEFHGVWLGKDSGSFPTKNVPSRKIDKLPVAFVNWYFAKRYTLDASHKHATVTAGPLDRFDAVGLTGETANADGYEYWETDEGYWIRASTSTKTEPGPPPKDIGDHEKWIDVNLKRQTLVAFEGTTPVFVTLVSSGRNEHETPPGIFRIREKHITSTMDGDADTATDGPYSIEDVPYIQYFNAGYALHGAFWHAEFGHIKSHGCVNLAPWDAKALFAWTDPELPDGWHAVFTPREKPTGTRVIVHERADGTCKGPKADPPQCPDGIR